VGSFLTRLRRAISVYILRFLQHKLIRKEDDELHQCLAPILDISKEFLFWKNELGFEDDQFYKTQVRKLQKSSFNYRESFRHGTCSLYFSSVEKKVEIMGAIRAFLDHS
jgi:hypothetical protein